MKTKNKKLAIVQIAVVLCSVFLVAIPAIAADQNQELQKASANTITTASEDDYVLGIYGNANEDDTIDMGDVVYTKLAIFGKKPKTELCDAKYDGRINVLDVIQTKLIILGKEKELTVVDSDGDVITVPKPVNRIVVEYNDRAELMRSLDVRDKVVGVDRSVKQQPKFYPELSKLPQIGAAGPGIGMDYELIISLDPDVFIAYHGKQNYEEKLPGVTIIWLDLNEQKTLLRNIRTFGYILDKREEAEELIDWYEGHLNSIKAKTGGLSEDDKPRVYFEWWKGNFLYYTIPNVLQCDIAGGRNIADDLPSFAKVDPEWLMNQNPDFIVKYKSLTDTIGYEIDDTSNIRALRELILNIPELANVKAIKTGSVYVIDMRHFGAFGGPTIPISTAYFAKWFHPDLFEDLDPEAIHQEYVTRFQRIDFNVYEHGVWVWPPLE